MEWHLLNVATCGYIVRMTEVGIRELKNNLSRYIRRVAAGERLAVTDRGRVVAELTPPAAARSSDQRRSRYDKLVAAGVIRPPLVATPTDDPFADWPMLRLPRGTAAALIDADREER